MKCKLSDICVFRQGKISVDELNKNTYISTENMLPNKGGITEANSLPTVSLTQEYRKGDVLVSNIPLWVYFGCVCCKLLIFQVADANDWLAITSCVELI